MLELFPWGQVTSERDKSGVQKRLHHPQFFFGQWKKSRAMVALDHVLAIILFFASFL